MTQYLMIAANWGKHMFNKFLRDEKGEVNIVATVVLIGVAVILAILFKDAIADLLQKLLGKIGENAGTAFETVAPVEMGDI